MIKQQLKKPFYISVFGGLFLWLLVFIVTPANVTYPLAFDTMLFIFLSYISLIAGYLFKFKTSPKNNSIFSKKTITYITFFILFCYFIRFIDIFYFRGLRFSNTIYQNRDLAGNGSQNLVFIIASIFKSGFFIPLLLVLRTKIKSNLLLFLSGLLFILPFFEAILRGSRSTFFQSFIFLLFVLIFTRTIRFTKRSILLLGISSIVFFIIATQILIEREGPKNENPYAHLVEKAIYNDFYKPKQRIIDFMHKEHVPEYQKKIGISALQIGQYYTHGLFEFDYVVKHYQKKPLEKQYGKFTFNVIPKFTNHFKFTHIDLQKIYISAPRGYTFIGLFGGLFIDFGWFALVIFFLLGLLQKYVHQKTTQNKHQYAPLFVFLLFSNFFMLTFNFFKGGGTYTLISCVIFAILFNLLLKINRKKYEKGIST